MKQLVEWLSAEWEWKRAVVAIFAFVLFWLAVSHWLNSIFPGYGPNLRKGPYPYLFVINIAQPTIFVRALLEEVLFRLAPVCLAVIIWNKSQSVLLVAFGASFIFAVSHKISNPATISHFVFGIMLCLIFLKCGGYRKNDWWGPAKALFITTLMHALYNLCIPLMWWFLSRPVKLSL